MDYVSAYCRQVKSIPLGNSLTLSTIKRKEATKVFKCKKHQNGAAKTECDCTAYYDKAPVNSPQLIH
jgi:hypothetical protein